ncbi:hypothetical protein HOD38_00185 [archaeon]|jgi:hypothetical protein|nr:hypothetical protein [archaeon]MBT4396664.1 hypothetical protein [archaeon]MBT4441274.1 hypothetical protein [archaeon]
MEEKKPTKEEQIGIHKGALSVLAIEQQEFYKLLQVVQQQIEAHVKALKELGVDLEAEASKAGKAKKDDLDTRLG